MTSRFKFIRQQSRTSSYLVFHRISSVCLGELWKDRDGSWLGLTAHGQQIHYPGSRETAAGILSSKYTGA